MVNKSRYGRGTDFKQYLAEYTGYKCYSPTNVISFRKSIKYLTGKDYMNDFLTFLRIEKRRKNVMTSARFQSFCKEHNINIGCSDDSRINPKDTIERYIALNLYKNHFALIWKSNGISFNKAIEELKINFKIVDNCISKRHIKSFYQK